MISKEVSATGSGFPGPARVATIPLAYPIDLGTLLRRPIPSSRSSWNRFPRERSNTHPARLAIDSPGHALPSLRDLKIDFVYVALGRPIILCLPTGEKWIVRLKFRESPQLSFEDS
jgi:hypothetical protein